MDVRGLFSGTIVLGCMYFCQARSGFARDHGAGHLDPTMSISRSGTAAAGLTWLEPAGVKKRKSYK